MNKNYCTFYIVRHGETEWNVKDLLQGQKDSNLTKKGIEQAKLLAKKFKNIKLDAIFSSDLIRAKKTAEIIALEHKIAVRTKEILRERNFGKLEGRREDEIKEELKDLFLKFEKAKHEEKLKFRYVPDMESDEELISRLITFLREIAVAYSGKTVLVVSHGGMMRTLLIHLGYGTYDELPPGSVENTGYAKILSDGIDFFIDETAGVTKRKGIINKGIL